MDNQDRILARINKMLRLANDASASEGERDNAMRMAHATMAKYNLDMAEVTAAGTAPAEERGVNRATFYGRPWARRVAQSMAKLFFCKYLYVANSDAKQIVHQFVGLKSNAATAAEMTKYLVESIRREARAQARSSGHGSAWARSFADGTSIAIWHRVIDMVRTAPTDTSESRALVLANLYQLEDSRNQELIDQVFNNLRKGRGGKSGGLGYSAGQEYGSKVSLNRQVNNSATKREFLN